MNEMDDRITELEIRFSHQGRLIDELNGEVLSCHQRIDRLEKENRRFAEMLNRMEPEHEVSPDE